MPIYHSVEELIGNTPLLEIADFNKEYAPNATVLAKLEYFNPAGSAKDRVAKSMIAEAEASGKLIPGGTIIEPTSGNTGIGLCALAAKKGYKCIIIMPDSMSAERCNLMKAYGAQLILTPGADGMAGCIKKAEELQAATPNAIIAGQFDNPANPLAHYQTTGPEIWSDTNGGVDIFIASIGTGGTITGTAKYLKEQNPNIKIIGIEPATSPLLTQGYAGAHEIQGIGANFIPSILDQSLIDEVLACPNEDAFTYARAFGKLEGILVGISSGSALWAAAEIAARPENAGKTIVTLLPDTGDRYLSTKLYNGEA